MDSYRSLSHGRMNGEGLRAVSVCVEVGRGRIAIGAQLHRAEFPMSVLAPDL